MLRGEPFMGTAMCNFENGGIWDFAGFCGHTRPKHACIVLNIFRVGQNRIYAPYMTVHLVVSLPKTPYIHRIYRVLAYPKYI